MQSFLNELSLPESHSTEEVIIFFDELGKCFQKTAEIGVKEIKIHSSFYNHEFAPGYYFINWLDDRHVDKDLRTLLKGALGIVPFVDDMFKQYEKDNNAALEMSFDGDACIGLGLSSELIFNTVAFSYNSSRWDQPELEIAISIVTETEDGDLTEEIKNSLARNIATLTHAATQSSFIRAQITSSIEDGKELWLRRKELFPNLLFCDKVKAQLVGYHYNTLGFQQIILRLTALQQTAERFDGTPTRPEDFTTLTTRESETRLRDFRNELTILCPDGQYRLFDWHVRFTPGAGRIHFFPVEDQKMIIVGSIANQNTIK